MTFDQWWTQVCDGLTFPHETIKSQLTSIVHDAWNVSQQQTAQRCAEIALEQMFPVDIGSFGDTVSKEEAHNLAVENIADAIRREFEL